MFMYMCNNLCLSLMDVISDCRSREFLWQEGHTAYTTQAKADAEV
jgi:hypothetical protein